MFSSARVLYANSNAFCRRTNDYILQVLQSSMRKQLARLKHMSFFPHIKKEAHKMGTTFGPMTEYLQAAENMLEMQQVENKLWFAGQYRDLAVAATLLKRKEVIAVPTDTVYGLACLANDTECIQKMYDIKGRDSTKPLAICVAKIEDIPEYGIVTQEVQGILKHLLPGPYTIVLRRTAKVNQDLNPDHRTIGIRVPDSWFIRNVVEMSGPIALTSANKSGKGSSLHIEEFSELWPQLGGIFHTPYITNKSGRRKGSTVIDFTVADKYKIIRAGFGCLHAISYLDNKGFEKTEQD